MVNVKNSKEVQMLRVIFLEFSRLLNHFDFLVKFSSALGLNSIVPELLTYKSKIKELLEYFGGSRLHYDIFRVGGFKRDFTFADIKKIKILYLYLNENIHKQIDIFESLSIKNRTQNIGLYKLDNLHKICLSGINLRTSGVQYDVRRERPYECYNSLKFVIPVFEKNDCYHRLLAIICEIESSLKIISECLKEFQEDFEYTNKQLNKLELSRKTLNMDFEIPTGKLELKLHANNKNEIVDVDVLTPTQKHIPTIENFVIDEDVEDLNLILASLNLDFSELYKN